jgi:hypothetical protein
MPHPLWKTIVRDRVERLRAEIDQLERHTEEGDFNLAWQTLPTIGRSIQNIRAAMTPNPGPQTPIEGDFQCPGCNAYYCFYHDGQYWTFQLIDRYPGR